MEPRQPDDKRRREPRPPAPEDTGFGERDTKEIRSRIGRMVEKDAGSAAGILKRWIRKEKH